jgi:purine-cytosine permease-like protein
MKKVMFAGYKIRLPGNMFLRVMLGILLVLGGFLWFLPVLGLWMLPLGLIVLSVDFAFVRRHRRWVSVKLGYWLHRRYPNLAQKLGYGPIRKDKG